MIAPDAVLVSDGGGLKQAAPRPIVGGDKVARFMLGGADRVAGAVTADLTAVNGNPAFIVRLGGEIDGVLAVRLGDARIAGLYYVRNPEKLSRLGSETPLTTAT